MSRSPLRSKRMMALSILPALVMGIALLIRAYAAPFFLDLGIPFGMAWSVVAACVLLGLLASFFGGAAALVFCARRLVRG